MASRGLTMRAPSPYLDAPPRSRPRPSRPPASRCLPRHLYNAKKVMVHKEYNMYMEYTDVPGFNQGLPRMVLVAECTEPA